MLTHSTSRSQKPVLLVFPFALMAHYLRCVVLCRHLRKVYDIKFLYHQSFNSFVRDEGFDTFHCAFMDPQLAIESVKRFDFSWLNRETLETVFLEQSAAIEKLRPTAVLGDYSPTLKMAADHTNTPFISLLNGYMTKYYAETRKISRSHPAHKFVRHLPSAVRAALTNFGEKKAFKNMWEPFMQLRRKYQLPPGNGYLSEFEGEINLVCDLPELFPQKSLPANYYVIGPLYYDRGIPGIHHDLRFDNNKKTLLVSMGSSGNWAQVCFLNDKSFDRFNILAVGDIENVLNKDHIHHLPFTSMHDVFASVDLMICHGGNGTLYQGLYYDLPILISTNHCEQEWNLAAFDSRGAATGIDEVQNVAEILKLIENKIAGSNTDGKRTFGQAVRNYEKALPGILDGIFYRTPVVNKTTTAQPV
jgi:UDP:flavonoid glycosyltransferase YjiC (YdhE family)